MRGTYPLGSVMTWHFHISCVPLLPLFFPDVSSIALPSSCPLPGPASKRQCCQEEPLSTRNASSDAATAATAHTSSDNSENSSGSTVSIASCNCSLPDSEFPVPTAALARRRPHPNAHPFSTDPEAPESRPNPPQHCNQHICSDSPCSSDLPAGPHQNQQKRVRFAVSAADRVLQVAHNITAAPSPTSLSARTHEWIGPVKHSVCGKEGLLCRTTILLPLHVPKSELGRQLVVSKLVPRRGIQLGDHLVCRCSIADASKAQVGQLELLAKREIVVVARISGGKSMVLVPYQDKTGCLKLVSFILLL